MSNELGQWIERECAKRGWSQRTLASKAGISQAPISRTINKVSKDDQETICGEKVAQAIARAFGADPVYVLRLARILKEPLVEPDSETLEQLAPAPDLDMFYIEQYIGLSSDERNYDLSDRERALIEGYRVLNGASRQIVGDVIQSLRSNNI